MAVQTHIFIVTALILCNLPSRLLAAPHPGDPQKASGSAKAALDLAAIVPAKKHS